MLVNVRSMIGLAVVAATLLLSVAKVRATDSNELNPSSYCLACRHLREGCPLCVACYALPSNTPRDTGYYVGGGAAFFGQRRCSDEGTWGWDYAGIVPKQIALNWWHGRRYQGGTGSYRTDGPRLAQPH
jgi:hypothetical protein